MSFYFYCRAKAAPKECAAGEFRSIAGASAVSDDWACAPCPDGEFASKPNRRVHCDVKVVATSCGATEVLVPSGTRTLDNACAPQGKCGPGEQVAGDGATCMRCATGKFNSQATTGDMQSRKNACVLKPPIASCGPGHYLSLGPSRTRNDWRCARCQPGQVGVLPSLPSSPPLNCDANFSFQCATWPCAHNGKTMLTTLCD